MPAPNQHHRDGYGFVIFDDRVQVARDNMPRGFKKRVFAARLGKWRGIGGDHVLGDFAVVMKGERQYRADLKFGGENRCAD